MERVMIQLPKPLKAKLDSLRSHGYTASGYIRALLEREFSHTTNMKGEVGDGTKRTPRPRIDE